MLSEERLERLLELHARSYRIFTWVNQGLRDGRRGLAAVQETMSFAEAAAQWIRRT